MSRGTGATNKIASDSDPVMNAESHGSAADIDFDESRLLYVGTQGNLTVVTAGGQTVTYVGVVGFLPILIRGIRAASSTADSIISHW